MSKGYSEEVDNWIRSFTTEEWGPTPATHCMSDRYQRLDPRAWPFPGVPKFPQRPAKNYVSKNGREELDVAEDLDEPVRDDHDKMVKFIAETRTLFREILDDGPQGASLLRDEINRLEEDTGTLAALIDEKFKVVRVRSEEELSKIREKARKYPKVAPMLNTSERVETNIGRETGRLLDRLYRDFEEGSEVAFRNLFDSEVEIDERCWRLTYEQSSSAHLISKNPQRDDHDLLRPLGQPKVRPCVSMPSAGLKVGLEYFPVDVTVEQAETYFEHYLTDVGEEADEYGNTHAHLYFRLLIARNVYREYQQYGRVEKWDQDEIEKEWRERDFDSSRLHNPFALMETMEKLLATAPHDGKDDAWRKEDGTWLPNAAGLHGLLESRNRKVLRKADWYKDSDGSITPQTLRDYVKLFTETKLVRLRSKAGLDPK